MSESVSASQLAEHYCHFYDADEFDDTLRPGFRRRVITGEQLQLCFWRIDGGAEGSYLHRHDVHEQIGIVVRGALDFRIGDPDDERRMVLREGDIYLAPTNVWHGDSKFIGDDELNECWILDVFAPPRDDLLAGDAAATNAESVADRNGVDSG
ncbi:MAG: cupin domain-containing protein [Actinomycetota bacterium]